MYRGPNNIEPAPLPLTAQELMWLHGLTVEEGIRQGYCIKGHEKEWRAARRAAREHERQALGGRRRERDYCDKPKKPKKPQPLKPDADWIPPPRGWRQALPENMPESVNSLRLGCGNPPPSEREAMAERIQNAVINTTKHVGRVSETREITSDAIQNTSQTQTEVFTNMDKNTRILLLIHLMSSETFAAMPQTEKAILLTELLYGKDKPEAAAAPEPEKKTGGRPKKAAPAAEQAEDVTA